MADFDVFNGDADGICALTQLRLAEPRESTLVSGVKRDISLLKRVTAGAGDRVTVLDVSMEKNTDPLKRILDAGAEVLYVDHHVPGEIPAASGLTAIINEAPDVCTALLVNGHLKNRFVGWALVGAFGDNLKKSAHTIAKQAHYSESQLDELENLGICMNYNGYGESVSDLHFAPEELFRCVSACVDPLDFIHGAGREHFQKLDAGYKADMASAQAIKPELATESAGVFMFPDEPWARRVSGVFGNDLANEFPSRAHAVITAKNSGTYLISVRAPLSNKTGAAELCKQFPTGGGRAAAAGINDLPADMLGQFIDTFQKFYAASA